MTYTYSGPSNSVKIREYKDDQGKIPIGVKLKDGNKKIRITGAVIRLEVMPHKSYAGADYKFSIWLPNKTQIEGDDSHSVISFGDLMCRLVEAATGEKPKDPNQVKVVELNGFPVKVPEEETKTFINPTDIIDPLTEEIKLLAESKPATTTQATSSNDFLLDVVWCPMISGWVTRGNARWDDPTGHWIPIPNEFGIVIEAKTKQKIQLKQLESGAWTVAEDKPKGLGMWDDGFAGVE